MLKEKIKPVLIGALIFTGSIAGTKVLIDVITADKYDVQWGTGNEEVQISVLLPEAECRNVLGPTLKLEDVSSEKPEGVFEKNGDGICDVFEGKITLTQDKLEKIVFPTFQGLGVDALSSRGNQITREMTGQFNQTPEMLDLMNSQMPIEDANGRVEKRGQTYTKFIAMNENGKYESVEAMIPNYITKSSNVLFLNPEKLKNAIENGEVKVNEIKQLDNYSYFYRTYFGASPEKTDIDVYNLPSESDIENMIGGSEITSDFTNSKTR